MRSTTANERIVAERYRLGELLGRGGMADVYAATDLRLSRPVAVKVLRADMAARPDVRVRFEAEARAAAGLSHPRTVSVYDFGEYAGRPYLVMERLPGETLAHRMAGGPADPAWLRGVLADVLGALGAAHAAGIIHRDVKPANILLAADGSARVADFGIAKSVSLVDDAPSSGGELSGGDLTLTGHVLGTPAYVAPERLDGKLATVRSDLYSVGVVAYEALAGVKPFRGDEPIVVARAVVDGTHLPLAEARPGLDAGWVAVVEKAMARNPEERFASAAEMAAALASPAGAAGTGTLDMLAGGGPPPAPDHTLELAGPELAGLELAGPELAGPELAGQLPPPRPVRAQPPPSRPWRWRRLRLLGVLASLGAVGWGAGYLVARDSPGPAQPELPSTTAGPAPTTLAPTTVAPTTTTQPSLLLRLTALAGSLSRTDGRRAEAVAAGLVSVVNDLVQGRDAGRDADGLMRQIAGFVRTGDLSQPAAAAALDLLRQVPGAGPVPTTVLPTTTTAFVFPNFLFPTTTTTRRGQGNNN